MNDEGFLSPEQRDALRKFVAHVKKRYRISNESLATYARINVHALRNFLAGRDPGPKGNVLSHLCAYMMDKFADEGDSVPDLRDALREIFARYAPKAPTFGGELRTLFPDIYPDLICRVPDSFRGTYVIYRRAAIGGDIVRASLLVEDGNPAPTFLNAYQDSIGRTRTTKGFVFSTGTALQLLGHIAPFPTLKLITFDWPEPCDGEELIGLTVSNDYRNRFFASRCVAVRSAETAPQTGIFSRDEIDARTPWLKEYHAVAKKLENTMPEGNVLFLDAGEMASSGQHAEKANS